MSASPVELGTSLLQNAVTVLVGAAGLMISFIWGFVALHPADSSPAIKWASALLVVTVISGILSLQFAISVVSSGGGFVSPIQTKRVAVSFGAAWFTFILGAALVAWAIPGSI